MLRVVLLGIGATLLGVVLLIGIAIWMVLDNLADDLDEFGSNIGLAVILIEENQSHYAFGCVLTEQDGGGVINANDVVAALGLPDRSWTPGFSFSGEADEPMLATFYDPGSRPPDAFHRDDFHQRDVATEEGTLTCLVPNESPQPAPSGGRS